MKHICKKYTFFNLNLLRENKRLTKGLGSLRAEIFLEKIFTELTFAVSAINDENKFRETYKILKTAKIRSTKFDDLSIQKNRLP